MQNEIEERVRGAIAWRVFPGCVIGIVAANGKREVHAFGQLTYDPASPLVCDRTIYDIASVTKSIPLASLALQLAASSRLNLDEQVKTYVPELQHDLGATIRDLLLYRVQGPALSTLSFKTFEELRTHVLERGFATRSNESHFTNMPAFVLGLAIERATGEILPALADRLFFAPLQMHDTTYFPHDIERVAPTEIIGGRKLRGIVHDESARLFTKRRRAVGHAGVFSTAPDLLNFLEALIAGRFFAILDGATQGLGWQTNQPWLPQGGFGKTGFTGTSVAVDPKRGIGLVILSNRTYPTRPPDDSAIMAFRKEVANVVFSGV
jgi:CubicO group peptidase (beta-lactamase class C family)